ncbi:hypothetical protein N566_18740 [Streptomycetaceae bacterium MP113-05]|nr:hypothetical protein N566_18740 [Streptomycetaceae bacterium MP113-05]
MLGALPEPPRPRATLRGVLRDVPSTVVGGLRLGARDGLVRRVLLSTCAVGAALATIELLTPGRAAEVTGSSSSGATLFAALACAGFACTALGSQLAPRLAQLLGGSGERAVLASLLVSGTGLTALGLTLLWSGPSALALAAVGYALVYVGLGAKNPNLNDLLHRRVDSTRRATALSVQSLALQSTAALVGLGVGSLAGGPLPWLLGAAALPAAACLWSGRRTTVSPQAPEPGAGARTTVSGTPAHRSEPGRR